MFRFVEQEDVMYRTLTVWETIMYSALLRLPNTIPKSKKLELVSKVIMELGLNDCANTVIGDESKRGISGGERKRVAIGIETVTFPSLLFLDEPTSGLDSFTAFNIIDSLHKSTRKSMRSVILTIHQPREDIFFLFDKLLLLSQGRIAYWGPTGELLSYLNSLGYECPRYVNPADFSLDTVTVDPRSDEAKLSSTERVTHILDNWDKIKSTIFITPSVDLSISENSSQSKRIQKPNPWFTELYILFSRNAVNTRRDVISIFAIIFQTLVLLLLLGFTFFQLGDSQHSIASRVGVLIFIAVNMVFSVVQPLITLFPLERNILIRERYSSTYRVSAFFIAKVVSILPFRIITTLVYGLSIYYIIGLNPLASCYFIFQGILLVLVFASQGLGLFIGASVPNVQLAQIIGPLIILVFFIYGGNLANSTTIPWELRWLQYLSIIRYAYMALFQNEFNGLTFRCYDGNFPPPGGTCTPGYSTGEEVIMAYNMNEFSITACCLIILGLGFVFLFVAYFTLRTTSKPTLRLL